MPGRICRLRPLSCPASLAGSPSDPAANRGQSLDFAHGIGPALRAPEAHRSRRGHARGKHISGRPLAADRLAPLDGRDREQSRERLDAGLQARDGAVRAVSGAGCRQPKPKAAASSMSPSCSTAASCAISPTGASNRPTACSTSRSPAPATSSSIRRRANATRATDISSWTIRAVSSPTTAMSFRATAARSPSSSRTATSRSAPTARSASAIRSAPRCSSWGRCASSPSPTSAR